MYTAATFESLQAQTFIRGLKTTESSNSQKISWACEVWKADTPSLPNKSEIVTEWILDLMLIGKADNNREEASLYVVAVRN